MVGYVSKCMWKIKIQTQTQLTTKKTVSNPNVFLWNKLLTVRLQPSMDEDCSLLYSRKFFFYIFKVFSESTCNLAISLQLYHNKIYAKYTW